MSALPPPVGRLLTDLPVFGVGLYPAVGLRDVGWGAAFVLGGLVLGVASYYRHRVRALETSAGLARAELAALRTHVRPHFLFNALNATRGFLVRGDAAAASAYIGQLARLLRAGLENSAAPMVALRADLDEVGRYVRLERVRYGARFSYGLVVGDGVDASAPVPPGLTRAYVEAAIGRIRLRHPDGRGRLEIVVEARRSGELGIVIRDDGLAELPNRSSEPATATDGARAPGEIEERLRVLGRAYGFRASVVVATAAADAAPWATKVSIRFTYAPPPAAVASTPGPGRPGRVPRTASP